MRGEANQEFVTRFLPMQVAKVDVSADEKRLTGYAIVFNTLSLELRTKSGIKFRERILPEAVERTLRSGKNVDALLDHRREITSIIGSTDSGLLRLRPDRRGLAVEITPPDTAAARDMMAVVKAGLVKGMSFAFRPTPDGEDVFEEEGSLVREISDMDFSEVSIVVSPAYPQTEISARNEAVDEVALRSYMATQRWKPSLRFRERMLRASR